MSNFNNKAGGRGHITGNLDIDQAQRDIGMLNRRAAGDSGSYDQDPLDVRLPYQRNELDSRFEDSPYVSDTSFNSEDDEKINKEQMQMANLVEDPI